MVKRVTKPLMAVVRDILLSVLFLLGTLAVVLPYVGVALPEFTYAGGAGKPVDLPVSVALYAAALLAAVAAFVLRVLPKQAEVTK